MILGASCAALWLALLGLPELVAAGLAASLLLYGAGRLGVPALLAKLVEILRAMLATGLGLLRSLRGERFQTWDVPASSRRAG